MTKIRCAWCEKDDIYRKYHDEHWGKPVKDDQKLFEFLNLEGAQAGLSWYTILIRMETYAAAFANWDVHKILKFSDKKKEALLQNPGIIRNKLKVNAVFSNAEAYLKIQKEYGSFANYIWEFVDHKPIVNNFKKLEEVPATTEISDALSKSLKKHGFKFVGSTICYAFMQAVGMVDDHIADCWVRSKK